MSLIPTHESFRVAQATSPARSRDREARWSLVRAQARRRTPYLSSGRVLAARLTSGEKVLLFLATVLVTCLSAYRRESRCRRVTRSTFAAPPRAA